jgi:ABC-type bacteriocin/lantibiotic exporter with double-glycine peptidase domain
MIVSLEPVMQKDIADCGVASLAMVLNVPYRIVSEEAMRIAANPHKTGLWETELEKIGRVFGARFKRVSSADDVTGLLVVVRGKGKSLACHIVALFQGVVINPADGLLWEYDTYLAQGKWSPASILERVT